VALFVTLALLVASLVANVAWARSSLTAAFHASPLRAWELLAWAGLMALGMSALHFDHETSHPGWITLVPVGASALLIAALGASPGSLPARGLGSLPARVLGARSYSIYLWHWPVSVLGGELWPQLEGAWRALALLSLSLLLAEAAYRWVEIPARWRWARGARPSAWLAAALLASSVLVAAGIGLGHVARERGLSAQPRVADRPAGLPPLAWTQADLPVVYANGCHAGIEATAPGPACRLGGTANGPTVALLGDSHAAQWAPPLLQVAGARGVAVLAWTKSGCPMVDVPVWNAAARARYLECDRWREAVLAELARQRPAAVFVSNLMDDATVVVDPASGRALRDAEAAAAFDSALERTLRRLRGLGLQVVLIRDTPRARTDVLGCLYSQPNPRACERRRAEAAPADARELRAAAGAGVPTWDFSEAICGPHTCPVFMENVRRSVYRDAGRLSATFAASLAPAVAARWAATPGLP